MDIEPEAEKMADQRSNFNNPDTFSPVTVSEMVGTIALGLLSLILIFALLRSQARNRKLLEKLAARAAVAEA